LPSHFLSLPARITGHAFRHGVPPHGSIFELSVTAEELEFYVDVECTHTLDHTVIRIKLDQTELNTQFQNINEIPDYHAILEYFAHLAPHYEHKKAIFITCKKAAFYKHSAPACHLMCLADSAKTVNTSLFRRLPLSVLMLIREHMVNLDMSTAALLR